MHMFLKKVISIFFARVCSYRQNFECKASFHSRVLLCKLMNFTAINHAFQHMNVGSYLQPSVFSRWLLVCKSIQTRRPNMGLGGPDNSCSSKNWNCIYRLEIKLQLVDIAILLSLFLIRLDNVECQLWQVLLVVWKTALNNYVGLPFSLCCILYTSENFARL